MTGKSILIFQTKQNILIYNSGKKIRNMKNINLTIF